jgi:hypothetical protein
MESRLNKLDSLTHKELKTNINKVIKDIIKVIKEKLYIALIDTYNNVLILLLSDKLDNHEYKIKLQLSNLQDL